MRELSSINQKITIGFPSSSSYVRPHGTHALHTYMRVRTPPFAGSFTEATRANLTYGNRVYYMSDYALHSSGSGDYFGALCICGGGGEDAARCGRRRNCEN